MQDPTALYVHIPFCTVKCRYCAFYSEPVAGRDTISFVDALICEMSEYPIGKSIETVYIGGGSPSCLPADQLVRIVKEIVSRCKNIREFTIEFNPAQAELELLKDLRGLGVNRLSIGAQSFNQAELDFLGRTHSVYDIEKAMLAARRARFENVGLDLIFAIPDSPEHFWLQSLRSAFYLGPQHISAYSLTFEPSTPLDRARKSGEVCPVDEESDLRQYELAIEELDRAGYEHYEISNFARGGYFCSHNLTYWANTSYLGIGPSAGAYYQGNRTSNIADVAAYIEAVQEGKTPIATTQTPTKEEVVCETAVLNLRTIPGIDIKQFVGRTGFNPMDIFADAISTHFNQKNLIVAPNRIALSKQALPIADKVLCDFSVM
jgi:oxygen-independent coproporphyrinogen-3 oxidase